VQYRVYYLVYSTSKVWHVQRPGIPDKNMAGRRITPLTGLEKNRGSSPPCSRRLFNRDYSLLRANLPVTLSNEDVWRDPSIPGNRPLFDHIWYPFLLFREAEGWEAPKGAVSATASHSMANTLLNPFPLSEFWHAYIPVSGICPLWIRNNNRMEWFHGRWRIKM